MTAGMFEPHQMTPPTLSDLLKYDLVIWSSPEDSPAYIGADGALLQYLLHGRKLILSGQDVVLWDGGGAGFVLVPYMRDALKTAYVKDDAGSRWLSGVPGEVMDGLNFAIAGATARTTRPPRTRSPSPIRTMPPRS